MSERKKYLIVVAGGSGSRFGSQTPKQFLELGGISILQRTIERFASAVKGLRIITVLPREHRALWEDICEKGCLNIPQILADGGITRFHSVQNALAKVPDGAIVAIHDGVRPLISQGLISQMFSVMDGDNVAALIPVLPVTDTLHLLKPTPREASGNPAPAGLTPSQPSPNASQPGAAALLPLAADTSAPAPDRSRLYSAQTPQLFKSEDIKAAYTHLGFQMHFTDDASVAREYKIPLSYIAGERNNIKITTPVDLLLAEKLLTL